jgi:hypothetical protein
MSGSGNYGKLRGICRKHKKEINTTAPYVSKQNFERAKYPVDRIDLRKWLTEGEIASIKASQSEYARLVSQMGW